MRRSSSAPNSSVQRLPVNHRRHKVPPESRKRVAIACNSCNVRRIRCSGERPCAQCSNTSRECQYPAAVEKVNLPKAEVEELQARCARLEHCLEQAIPDEDRRRELLAGTLSGSSRATSVSSTTFNSSDAHEDDATTGEGRFLSDQDGTVRYLGLTSGAAFLDLVKEFMITIFPVAWPGSSGPESSFLGTLGSYQTYDSHPLPIHDADPFWLPSKTEMAVMTAQLRYFVQDGNGDFSSGGIYYWGDLDIASLDSVSLDPSSADHRGHRRLALFHAAFAMTCQLEAPTHGNNNLARGETFFARVRLLLGNPLDTTASTLYDIPVLAMTAMYLIEMNRRDAAYNYVSLGMHLAVVHGMHRGWTPDEKLKRAFWTLYVLDRWLSLLMGRPPAISDGTITLSLPRDVRGLPPAVGLRTHVELARITGHIVCNTFRIAPWIDEGSTTRARIKNALELLEGWFSDLPPELQMEGDQLSNDRGCCEIHMAYNQLVIITVRPMFFVAVKQAVAERMINQTWTPESHSFIGRLRQCVDAARGNLRLGRWLRQLNPLKLLAQSLHTIFNAAVILILNQLLFDTLDDNDAMGIIFAIECFDLEARSHSGHAQDCARILRELSTLVQRLRNREPDVAPYDVRCILDQGTSMTLAPDPTQQPTLGQAMTSGTLYNSLLSLPNPETGQPYDALFGSS